MSFRPDKLLRVGSSPDDLEGGGNDDIPSSSSSISRCSTDTTDHISELPTEILRSIVMRLTLKDAVKTSALSHTWRKLCSSLLDFPSSADVAAAAAAVVQPQFAITSADSLDSVINYSRER